MNRLQELYEKGIETKYGVRKLEYDRVQDRDALPKSIDAPDHTAEQEHHKAKMAEWKQRWGMDKLSCSGLLGLRLDQKHQEQSLADRINDDDRQRSSGMKLATAKVNYQGKPVRLWVEVTRF
jgi:hypothetical protein